MLIVLGLLIAFGGFQLRTAIAVAVCQLRCFRAHHHSGACLESGRKVRRQGKLFTLAAAFGRFLPEHPGP